MLFDGAQNHSSSNPDETKSFIDKNHITDDIHHLALSASASSPSIAELNYSHSVGSNQNFTKTTQSMNSNNNFFSLTEDDDDINISDDVNTCSTPTKPNADISRQRRPSSTGSNRGEASDLLFPIYEDPDGPRFTLPSQDLDSTTGSEWGSEAGSQTQLTSISKEQLFQMLQKSRTRYHKYKGRYADVASAYGQLENENEKVKNVMQQTQDKALRRISELKEQCQLEQKAKRHLEEELRSDLEEKEHIIKALQTKVVLLKSGGNNVLEDNSTNNGNSSISSEDGASSQTLINLNEGQDTSVVIKRDSEKVAVLEDKVRRLEALLTKCKESIKANKQKTTALTEVKDSLATQLAETEGENKKLANGLKLVQDELDSIKKREQIEELQIAETKMQMHQEIITKDEEVGKLRTNLKHAIEEKNASDEQMVTLKNEIDKLKQGQDILEKSVENEKAVALQEMSRGKAGALQTLKLEMEKQIEQLKSNHALETEKLIEQNKIESESKLNEIEREKQREVMLKDEETQKLLVEKEEENRLAIEEMELRLTAVSTGDDAKSKLLADLECRIQTINSEKKEFQSKLTDMTKKMKEKELEFKQEQKSLAIIMEQKLSDLTREMKTKDNSLQESQNQLQSLTDKDVKLSTEIHEIQISKSEIQENLELSIAKYEKLNDLHKNAIDEISALKDSGEIQASKLIAIEKELECCKEKIIKKEEELSNAKKDYDSKLNEFQKNQQNINVDANIESQKHIEAQLAIQKENYDVIIAKENEKLKAELEEKFKIESSLKELRLSHQNTIDELEKTKLNEQKAVEDVKKKEKEIERLETITAAINNTIGDEKETNNSLSSQLASSQEEQLILHEKLKEVETALNFANEDICKKSQRLEEKETLLRDQISQISQFELEMVALNDQLNQFQISNEKTAATISDLEKENFSLRNSNESTKDLKQQMITYQKELQDQIRQAEDHEKSLKKQIEDLEISNCDKVNEIKDLVGKHRNEVSQLKSDLELKIRLEREKETSFKELQVQSIDYQKKLQDQLEEKEKQVKEFSTKLNTSIQNHSKEAETASEKNDHLNAQINEIRRQNEELSTFIDSLSLEKSDHESEKNSLSANLQQLNDELSKIKSEKISLESNHLKSITVLEESYEQKIRNLEEIIKSQIPTNDDELEKCRQTILDLENRLSEDENQLLHQNALLTEEKEFAKTSNDDLERDKNDLQLELDSTKQTLHELQLVTKSKDSEIDDLKSGYKEMTEMIDSMKKDLTSTKDDKAAQLLEYEETLEDLEKQVSDQKEKYAELQKQIANQSSTVEGTEMQSNAQRKTSIDNGHDDNVKAIVKEYEKKLAENGLQHDEEIVRLKDATDHEIRAAVSDCRRQISELKEELYEKTSLYEDLIDRHAAELASKQKEMDEEVEACSRMYQTKLSELQSNSDRLANLAAAAASGSMGK